MTGVLCTVCDAQVYLPVDFRFQSTPNRDKAVIFSRIVSANQIYKEEKKEIWLSPMTKTLYQHKIRQPMDNTKTPPKLR